MVHCMLGNLLCAAIFQSLLGMVVQRQMEEPPGLAQGHAQAGQNHVVCIYSTGLCLRQHHIGGCASLDHCCACLQNLAGLLITEQLGRGRS